MEKKHKTEYLQNKLNDSLKRELKHILKVMPEAILILDPTSKKLTFTNAELQKMIRKYDK